MKVRRRVSVLCAAAFAVAGLTPIVAVSASASSGPIYSVMNTDETPPDGVWFRNSPHTADTSRITGLGVYMNEQVQLQCYAWGDAVGPYNDTLWYFVTNVSRPTVDGMADQGYLNALYINDSQKANVVDAGVSHCGNGGGGAGSGGKSTPGGRAVYYSPYGAGSHLPNTSPAQVLTIPDRSWKSNGHCSPSNTYASTPSTRDGKSVTTLAGWSLGRVGVLYELESLNAHHSAMLSQINYVLMIDPGGYEDLSSSCDSAAGGALAMWLKTDPSAHLVVLSGPVTLDSAHPVNGYASAGIQNYYFNAIRSADSGGNLRSRVLVCNYSDAGQSISQSHQTIYSSASYLTGQPMITSCPKLDKMKYDGFWHP